MSSCGSTSPSTGRSFKLEKPGRGQNSASRCIFGWTSSSKLMIFDVGWWRSSCKCPVIKVSAHCQTDQSFSDPLSEFLLLQSTEIAVWIGTKKRIRRPCLCVVSGQLGTHSINHSRHTFTVNMLFTHKGNIFSTRSFCVLPRYLCILTWAHKCWKRKLQSVVGCFHFCWESSETWWAASFLAPCSRHTEQLPPHD